MPSYLYLSRSYLGNMVTIVIIDFCKSDTNGRSVFHFPILDLHLFIYLFYTGNKTAVTHFMKYYHEMKQ